MFRENGKNLEFEIIIKIFMKFQRFSNHDSLGKGNKFFPIAKLREIFENAIFEK